MNRKQNQPRKTGRCDAESPRARMRPLRLIELHGAYEQIHGAYEQSPKIRF